MNTTKQNITYTFKSYTSGEMFDKNLALVESGKLAESDFDIERDSEGNIVKLKRKAYVVNAELPVIEIDGFTKEQNDHVAHLVAKQVESKNKPNIDEMTGDWATWEQVLQAPAVQRGGGGGFKVTADMVNDAAEVYSAVLLDIGMQQKAVDLIVAMATKRFSAASCAKVKAPVLEKIRESLVCAHAAIKAEDEATATELEPVHDLWVNSIDKVLNPEQELDEDMFSI
jgi:hypothetical protein